MTHLAQKPMPAAETEPPTPTRDPLMPYSPLRVMTFNVLYHGARNAAGDWPTRRQLVEEVLDRRHPCVVGFQEATEMQLEQLIHDHPQYAVVPGPVSGTTRLPQWVRGSDERVQDVGEWCPLFYRRDLFRVATHGAFWLSHTSDEPGSVLPGTWLPRVVNWARFESLEDGRAMSVFNTHIDFLPWAPKRSARILWERLQGYWDGTAQVVMGDFNAAPGSAIHRCLLRDCALHFRHSGSPTFRDAWEAAAHHGGPVETYHAGRGRRRWPGRIDHIFFRPGTLHVAKCITITHSTKGRFPSDHYPVMVEFSRRPHPHQKEL